MRELTPEERRIRAAEASQFAQNHLFKAMFDSVSEYLENKALSVDTSGAEGQARSQDIVRCKQLLMALQREIERRIADGQFAEFEMKELEKRSVFKVLRR